MCALMTSYTEGVETKVWKKCGKVVLGGKKGASILQYTLVYSSIPQYTPVYSSILQYIPDVVVHLKCSDSAYLPSVVVGCCKNLVASWRKCYTGEFVTYQFYS